MERGITAIFLTVLLIIGNRVVTAQDMTKYNTVMNPDNFSIDWASFYRTMDEKTRIVRQKYAHHLDITYGTDPKQKLDIYLPKANESQRVPVFLFLHGGGFREGDKAHYGGIAEPFLKNNIIVVVASYRLTTDGFHYPDQSNDVKDAIKWINKNVSQHGGDPELIFVGGHSAGAILSADVGVNRSWMANAGLPKGVLKGIAPVSAYYDLRGKTLIKPYDYVNDVDLLDKASPVLNVVDPPKLAVIAVGSLEKHIASTKELTDKVIDAGSNAVYIELDGADHADTALSMTNEHSHLVYGSIVRRPASVVELSSHQCHQ